MRSEPVLDFTSVHYLGLRHPSAGLGSWPALTTGVPAALRAAAGTRRLELRVAALCGVEAASLATSTLHLVWDVFGQLADEGVSLHVDSGSYETLWWGAERARGRGVPVRLFRHRDPHALASGIAEDRSGLPVVVVCDGLCPRCGLCAPLDAYLRALAGRSGRIVVDDTQALGLIGTDGGGTLSHLGLPDPRILVISSFAKGLGAPIAALAGSTASVDSYERASACRVHSSPPSTASLRALQRALRLNAVLGDWLRARLAARVSWFRAGVRSAGLDPRGEMFPVQAVSGMPHSAEAVHDDLARAGVRTVLRGGHEGPELCFVLRASHRRRDLDRALEALRVASSGEGSIH
jgi:8-amino-7-oxononanoate synthase